MYVPLERLPESLRKLGAIVATALGEFGIVSSSLRFANGSDSDVGLLDDFVLVDGENGQQCWISFSRCSVELSEREGYAYMADVQTRGSWDFAGGVAYGLCTFAGYVVFNDAGELDGRERYTASTLRETLLGRRG